MLIMRDVAPPSADEARPSFRIAVPSFGLLRDAVAPVIERQKISREEIIDIFADRLRPGKKPDPRYTPAEIGQADVARRLRQALYPKD